MKDTQALRKALKQERLSLSHAERLAAAAAAIQRIRRLPMYQRSRRLATFIGSNGELDPMPLAYRAIEDGKRVYLPVLHPFLAGRLLFCRWQPGRPLHMNRFGIPEPTPANSTVIPARHLDLVIMPLLGFDAHCHRLGMGGGYYDRTFAFRNRSRAISRPRLLGLAHEVQRVAAIDAMPWDIQPDLIVSNARIYRCS
jgi:5-formyltetrahydrofolate cyclo-ligase